MAYYLTNLLQDLYGELGSEIFLATGGSTTTAVNAKIAERAEKPEAKYAVDGVLFVVRDAGGAAAAPEGQFQRISNYDAGTYTYTVETALTVAVASGDTIMIGSSDFGLRDMIATVNRTMRRLNITLPDTSLTTVSEQQVYNLPVTAKLTRPRRVEIQSVAGDDETYYERTDYDYIPAAAGTVGKLRFHGEIDAGMTIRIFYDNSHPALTAYNSEISETLHPALALAECRVDVLTRHNNLNEGTDDYWRSRENIARDELRAIRSQFSVYKPKGSYNRPMFPR